MDEGNLGWWVSIYGIVNGLWYWDKKQWVDLMDWVYQKELKSISIDVMLTGKVSYLNQSCNSPSDPTTVVVVVIIVGNNFS